MANDLQRSNEWYLARKGKLIKLLLPGLGTFAWMQGFLPLPCLREADQEPFGIRRVVPGLGKAFPTE